MLFLDKNGTRFCDIVKCVSEHWSPLRCNVEICILNRFVLYSLECAIVSAAQRRRWMPKKTDEKTYRLTIVQRKNRCVVDVVMNGNKSFSILPVESNIPVRKYDQWVQNLWREIVHRANRGQ